MRQPSGWTQVSIGLGLSVLGLGVSFVVSYTWQRFVGRTSVAVGVVIMILALVAHLRRARPPSASPNLQGIVHGCCNRGPGGGHFVGIYNPNGPTFPRALPTGNFHGD